MIKRAYALADSPVLGRDGTLYVTSKAGLVALRPDGRKKWEYRSRPSHVSIWSPTVAKDGTIYSITSSGTVIALRPNGTKKWSLGMQPRAFDLLIGPEGTIYCADTTGCVFTIRPNGRRRLIFAARHGAEWKEAVGTGVGWAALAMAPDGVLYLAVSGPRLYAIAPNGKRLWSLGPSRFPVHPALEEQRSDNDKRWLAGQPGPDVDLIGTTIGRDGTVFVLAAACRGEAEQLRLHAISSAGRVMWDFDFEVGFAVNVRMALGPDGTVYVADEEGLLTALDSSDGRPKWRKHIDPQGWTLAGPTVDASGTIYVGCGFSTRRPGGVLCAFHPSGRRKWSMGLPDSPSAEIVIGPGNTLYVLTDVHRGDRGNPTQGSLLAIGEK